MLGNIGPWQILIVLLIVVLIFGTKKLRNMGGDLGGALKNFKKAVKEDDDAPSEQTAEKLESADVDVIEGEAKREDSDTKA